MADSQGDSSPAFWELFRLSETLLKACESGVDVWPVGLSLLGVIRFGYCFAPWHSTATLAMSKANQDTFRARIESAVASARFRVGWMDSAVELKPVDAHLDVTVRVEFVVEPPQGRDDIFPLISSHVIGHHIALPSRFFKLLDGQFGVDWQTKIFAGVEKVNPKLLVPPVRSPQSLHIRTFDEWLARGNWCRDDPFFIPHFPFLNYNRAQFGELLSSDTQQIRSWGGAAPAHLLGDAVTSSVYSYDEDNPRPTISLPLVEGSTEGYVYCGISVYYMQDGATCWRLLEAGRLPVNIHDQEVSVELQEKLLPPAWLQQLKDVIGDDWSGYALTWVMTNAPKVSGLHTDPDVSGGAWMYLIDGDKLWWWVRPADWKYLQSKGYKESQMTHYDMNQLLQLEDGYLHGRIYTGRLTSGSAVLFPSLCLHKVITLKECLGFGGYW